MYSKKEIEYYFLLKHSFFAIIIIDYIMWGDNMNYTDFESRLIKNENISFIKMLIERDIKNYKYNIKDDDIIDYINRFDNKTLHEEIKKYNISDSELKDIRTSIIKTSKYNLDIEYLPTEDWELLDFVPSKKELVIELPNYEMLSNGLAFIILIAPFAALYLSYFLMMIFR